MGAWNIAAAAIGCALTIAGLYFGISTGNIFLAFVIIAAGMLFLMASR